MNCISEFNKSHYPQEYEEACLLYMNSNWDKNVVYSSFKHDIISNLIEYIQKGWDNDRIMKWMNVYVPQKYNIHMMTPMIDYDMNTPINWQLLYSFDKCHNLFDEVNKAYEKYPNDIDKAYYYMCEITKKEIEKKINQIKSVN